MTNKLRCGYLYKSSLVVAVLWAVDLVSLLFARRKPRPKPIQVKKILIIKPDHLGDCILSSSAIQAIKRNYPNCQLDYLIGPWSTPVVKSYLEITNTWLVRHAQLNRKDGAFKKWFLFLRDLFMVFPLIRNQNYDMILILRAFGGNFAYLSRFMNCAFVAGHGTGGGGHWLDARVRWNAGVHEIVHFEEVLTAANIQMEFADRTPFFPAVAAQFDITLLPSRYICIHPGAGILNKELKLEEWVDILKDISTPIVVCGSKNESRWIQEVGLSSRLSTIDLTDKLSVADLRNVFDHALAIHALDSFPAHIAATTSCPAIYVHFTKFSDPVQWRPIGPAVRVILH